ncbi:MAG: ATP phosphoribosyltransferase regulatory subunit [Rhodospirillales bacterium]|nr:ATP phosphoribosyltransferase regulatory subunit [Rhodospirillales bacterium]MBO6785935.1 ATP phosphoribosyltransferase regulatory subunit [Rhodospirillales bacterium]
MAKPTEKALLPAGLTDGLPPNAAFEIDVRERLVASFVQRGFDRIAPPLVEFEDNLLAGTGAAMAGQTFRLMDPISQRMMGLRADITPQAARIATTRLAHEPRPLRLCYGGEVLRIRGSQLRPERQFSQAGAELIGSNDARADAEMVLMAAETLRQLGISDIKVDLCQPTLVPSVMAAMHIDGDAATDLRAALDAKDAAEVKKLSDALGDDAKGLFVQLLAASGPSEAVAPKIAALPLSGDAAAARDTLLEIVHLIERADPSLDMTLDAVENRGFEYHTGVTFTLFAPGVRGEIGSGGRYVAGLNDSADNSDGEAATGFTLFLDSILRALEVPAETPKVYLPDGTDRDAGAKLRDDGYRTVQGHITGDGAADEARRLGCTHILLDGTPAPLGDL